MLETDSVSFICSIFLVFMFLIFYRSRIAILQLCVGRAAGGCSYINTLFSSSSSDGAK